MPDYESRHSLDPLVADTLRRYRQARRWSYRRAAKEIGISFGMLAMLEGGTRAPSTVVAEELIHAYRMNIADAEALRDVALSGVGRDWAPRPTNRHTEGASPCRP